MICLDEAQCATAGDDEPEMEIRWGKWKRSFLKKKKKKKKDQNKKDEIL